VIFVATVSTTGARPRPIASSTFPTATFILSVAVACAAADPPNSFESSRRISFCASAAFPPSTSALIWSFCCFVNDTPTALQRGTPLIGSFSAFPTWSALDFVSCPSATDMSVMTRVARSKILLPLPASLRTFVNVSSRFSPDWIASSSTPLLRLMTVASVAIWSAVTPATPPVDFRTAFVWCAILFDSWNASNARLPSTAIAANPTPAAATAPPATALPSPVPM
jgi:hypothetical protein